MSSDENSARRDEVGSGWAHEHDEAMTWNHDVRMGWQASDGPLSDERFYAVRNWDGKTVTARDREGLVNVMAADISRTLTDAFAAEPDPDLPEELR